MMSRNKLLVIGGGVLVVIAIGAALAFSYIQSLMAFKPLEISYATVQTAMPADAWCAGGGDEGGGVAKEIINLETDIVYVAGGANPMPDEVWQSHNFRLPILQNSTRNLLFDGSCFFRSPGTPATCSGDACFALDEIDGYTWLKLSEIAGQDCYPDASGCSADVVNPGYISITTIAKCHQIVYEGPVIYELADGRGNQYIMHATATGTPDLTAALPAGWTLTERTIDAPLELLPFGGGDSCYYNVVRDNLVQAYHQYMYAGEEYPG